MFGNPRLCQISEQRAIEEQIEGRLRRRKKAESLKVKQMESYSSVRRRSCPSSIQVIFGWEQKLELPQALSEFLIEEIKVFRAFSSAWCNP